MIDNVRLRPDMIEIICRWRDVRYRAWFDRDEQEERFHVANVQAFGQVHQYRYRKNFGNRRCRLGVGLLKRAIAEEIHHRKQD